MGSLKASFAGSSRSAGSARRLLNGSAAARRLPALCPGGGASAGRLLSGRLPLAAALAFAGVLLFAVGSASARDNGHAFSYEIKPTGTAAFSSGFGISGIAVDNSGGASSGDIYVIDGEGYRVEKFDSEGHFILMFGGDVNQTTGGDVCTAASGNTCKKGVYGRAADQFWSPAFIKVDPTSGDVYVADTFQRRIHKYDENGNLLTGYGTGGVLGASESTFVTILGMAVTESGKLLVRACQQEYCHLGEHVVLVTFEPNGTLEGVVTTPSEDPGENVFALSPTGFMYYRGNESTGYGLRRASSSDGSGVVDFSLAAYNTPYNGFKGNVISAAADSSGTVYAGLANREYPKPGRVWEWQVNGSGQPLDAEGNPCPTTLSASGPGCAPTHEFGSAVLSYYPRSIGVDDSTGKVYVPNTETKAIEVFIAAPEGIAETEDPSWVATAKGTAKPDGAGNITECYFQFGETTNYGSSKECSAAGSLPYSTDEAVEAELPVNGDGKHTYHYRLVVKNEAGAVTFGAEKTFVPRYVKGLQTLTAESVTRAQATLKGSYEDTGKETEYFFEWGTTACPCANKSTEEEATGTNLSTVAAFDGALEHLKPQTVYHYRVVAKNEFGTTYGEDKTFETLPAVQNLTTEAANPVERRKATVKGSFKGAETDTGYSPATTYTFEWGTTSSYGNTLPIQGPVSPGPGVLEHVSMVVDGCPIDEPDAKGCLEPSYSQEENPQPKSYHYRITATNALGTTSGADQQFTTLPAVASVKTDGATSIDQESITLNGEFDGNGEDTQYYFEYGLTPSYGMKTEPTDAGEASGPKEVSSDITEYEGYETYHYRAVAENAYGVTYGNDETFETDAAPLPEIANTQASGVTPTGAKLEAMINPNRWLTVYAFEYGKTTAYGETTEISEPIGTDKSFHPVSNQISGLEPGTVYHFRAVAINFTGTKYGPDQVLNTPDAPRIDLASSSGVGQTVAHLTASVSPNGSPTTVRFEYGTSPGYGGESVPVSIGSAMSDQQASADLSGLTPRTTYHYRVVASNGYGTTRGPDLNFVTQSASPPPPPPGERELKCRKGFVKRHGRCVRKHHRKHRHRRHHRHG